ncbi:serine/arginine-rich splicing factor SC35-like [Magnolia sinica]|uniref:serine/arginine-rich splicing factor SC35-like n=1 Tax=Magnolia sinica TaxID=86752 RepID=UPI0026580BC7|nr:serine/arginine-rich splicing factor SC35-like [Magnolia sinica]
MEERERLWIGVSPRKPKTPSSPFSIFAANLTYDTTSKDLKHIFGRFGKLADVFIPWNRNLNRSRGFFFIRFVYEKEAFNAIQCLHNRRIDGRVVSIAWAKHKKGSWPSTQSTPPAPQVDPNRAQPYLGKTLQHPISGKDPSPPSSKSSASEKLNQFKIGTDNRVVKNLLVTLSFALIATAENDSVSIL